MAGTSVKLPLRPDDYINTFRLFWLDAEINTANHNTDTQNRLRSFIKHLETFDDPSRCQQSIESLSIRDRVILIVSGRLGQVIVPRIHDLHQLSAIYIYCMNRQLNEEWTRQFPKVKDILIDKNNLIARIMVDHTIRVKIEKTMSYDIYQITGKSGQSTTILQRQFIYSQVLINALLRLNRISKDNQQLLSICERRYADNTAQLNMIRTFQQEYTPDKVLWWYTRDSFPYQLLNEALRQQDIDLLLLLRPVITDLYQQLKENQYKTPLTVYRCQFLTSSEIEYLQLSVKGFLSMKPFLLTTTDRDKAYDLCMKATIFADERRVLFVIEVDADVLTNKPFADIHKISSFIEQGEILFMTGSIFRLLEVRETENCVTVRMKLCDDREPELQHMFEYMKKINGHDDETNRINLHDLGDILRQMGKYDLAEKIYRLAISELPSNDPSLSDLYYVLGAVNNGKNEHRLSMKWYKKSLECKIQTNQSDFSSIGRLYGCIGEAHWRMENYNKALEYYKKAVKCLEKAPAENSSHLADFYSNIGSLYRRKKRYAKALPFCLKALEIDKQYPSINRSNVAKTHNDIGILYCIRENYDEAMKHYQISLTIKLKTLPPEHFSVGKSYRNIGFVYAEMGNRPQALASYQKAYAIFQKVFPWEHDYIRQIESDIRKIGK